MAESVQQPVAMVSEGHTVVQSEALQVTEPLQGPLPLGTSCVCVYCYVRTVTALMFREVSLQLVDYLYVYIYQHFMGLQP